MSIGCTHATPPDDRKLYKPEWKSHSLISSQEDPRSKKEHKATDPRVDSNINIFAVRVTCVAGGSAQLNRTFLKYFSKSGNKRVHKNENSNFSNTVTTGLKHPIYQVQNVNVTIYKLNIRYKEKKIYSKSRNETIQTKNYYNYQNC